MRTTKTLRNVAIFLAVLALAVAASISVSRRFSTNIANNIGAAGFKTQKSWVGQYLSGYHATQKKDYERASEFFSGSLTGKTSNEILETQTLSLLLVAGKFEEAVQVAEKLGQKSENGLAKLTLIAHEITEGRLDNAQKLAEADKGEAGTIINHVITAWIEYGKGNAAGALTIVKSLQGDPTFLPFVNYNYALIANLSGDKATAKKLYDSLLEMPKLPNTITSSAYDFYAMQNDTAKLAILNSKFGYDGKTRKHPEITTVKDGVAEALLGVGGIVMTEYSPDKSAAIFRLALYLNPKLDDAKLLLGSILMNEGDYKSANEILSQIGHDSYLGDYAKLAIAKNFESMNQEGKAKQYFINLAGKPTTRLDALVSLGDMARKDDKFEEAIEYYSKAIEAAQQKGKLEQKYWALYFARGVSYERLKQFEMSEKDLLKALEMQPNQPDVMNYLAYTWIDMGKNLDKAKVMVVRAHQEKPDDPQIIDSVGWAFYKLGEYQNSVSYLEAAASLLPYDPIVNDHLGDAYWKTGRRNEARFQWQRALRNEPDDKLAEELKRKLESGILVGQNEDADKKQSLQ